MALPFPCRPNVNGSLACVAEAIHDDPESFAFTIPADVVEKSTSIQLTIYCKVLLAYRPLIRKGLLFEQNVWHNIRELYAPHLLKDPRAHLPIDGLCNFVGCAEQFQLGSTLANSSAFCSTHGPRSVGSPLQQTP